MRRNPRRAEVDPFSPRGWATSDRNGHVGNLERMQFQFEWRGSTVQNTRVLVHEDELDIPQRQLGTLFIPPDPPPLFGARPENYDIDEQPVSTRYTMDGRIRIIPSPMPYISNRIVTTPGNLPTFAVPIQSGVVAVPVLNLTGLSIASTAATGTLIGTFSVTNPAAGTYTFSLTSNPGSLFTVVGSTLVNAVSPLTPGSDPITAQAANGPSIATSAFTVTVTGAIPSLDFSKATDSIYLPSIV